MRARRAARQRDGRHEGTSHAAEHAKRSSHPQAVLPTGRGYGAALRAVYGSPMASSGGLLAANCDPGHAGGYAEGPYTPPV